VQRWPLALLGNSRRGCMSRWFRLLRRQLAASLWGMAHGFRLAAISAPCSAALPLAACMGGCGSGRLIVAVLRALQCGQPLALMDTEPHEQSELHSVWNRICRGGGRCGCRSSFPSRCIGPGCCPGRQRKCGDRCAMWRVGTLCRYRTLRSSSPVFSGGSLFRVSALLRRSAL
jgi:hypothetical protein